MLGLERRALKLIGKKRDELRARADDTGAAGGTLAENEKQVLIRLERAIGLRREAWKIPQFKLHLGVAHALVEHALMTPEVLDQNSSCSERITVDPSETRADDGSGTRSVLKSIDSGSRSQSRSRIPWRPDAWPLSASGRSSDGGAHDALSFARSAASSAAA